MSVVSVCLCFAVVSVVGFRFGWYGCFVVVSWSCPIVVESGGCWDMLTLQAGRRLLSQVVAVGLGYVAFSRPGFCRHPSWFSHHGFPRRCRWVRIYCHCVAGIQMTYITVSQGVAVGLGYAATAWRGCCLHCDLFSQGVAVGLGYVATAWREFCLNYDLHPL